MKSRQLLALIVSVFLITGTTTGPVLAAETAGTEDSVEEVSYDDTLNSDNDSEVIAGNSVEAFEDSEEALSDSEGVFGDSEEALSNSEGVFGDSEETLDVYNAESGEIIEDQEAETTDEEAANAIIYSGTYGSDVTWALNEEGTLTFSGTGKMEDRDWGAPAWEFGDFDDPDAPVVTRVVIEEGITSIGSAAFEYCYSLTDISIPETVSSIGEHAFQGCTKLTSVDIPGDNVTMDVLAFDGCSSLTDVRIGGGHSSIGYWAFRDCSSLTTVTVEGGADIGENAFQDCSSLTDLVIGQGDTVLGDHALLNCTSLTEFIVPQGLKEIGTYPFQGCTNLQRIYMADITKWLEISQESPLFYGKGLDLYIDHELATELTIPEGTTAIRDYAFSGFTSLKKVVIPEGVLSIGCFAFYSSNPETVSIPLSVVSIGDHAFHGFEVFTEIYYAGSESEWDSIEKGSECLEIEYDGQWDDEFGMTYLSFKNATVNYGKKDDIASGSCGDDLTWRLDGDYCLFIDGSGEMHDYSSDSDNELGLAPWAKYSRDIKEIRIGDAVTRIGSWAFYCCGKVTGIEVSDNTVSIGEAAFANCSSLERFRIPSYVTVIEQWLFMNCQQLQSVEIPDGIKGIGEQSFYYCTNLTSVTIPDSVEYIRDSAFAGCENLSSVSLPAGLEEIEDGVFNGCASLSEIALPSGIRKIGSFSFYCCSSLSDINIPDGVESIEAYAFDSCTSLSEVNIPEGVTSIWEHAFYSCSGLRKITIPHSVISIGEDAFEYCDMLEEVDYLGSEDEWYAIDFPTMPYKFLSILKFADMSKSIEDALVEVGTEDLSDVTYTGSPVTPEVTVTLSGIILEKEKDYTVSYTNNINAGTATVTITGVENYKGTVTSEFEIHKAGQELTISNISLTYPKSGKISVSGNQGALRFISHTPSVVTVDGSGNIAAKSAGTAKITIEAAKTDNYQPASKTITVTVAKAAQSITAKSSASSVAVGKTATVSTTGAKGKVSYKSANTAIATVNASTGIVTAKKVGIVKITATAAATSNYKSAAKTVTINVVPAATKSVTAVNLSGKGLKLTFAKVTGANGYIIYRNGKEIKTITSGSTLTYTDTAANTNGAKYLYKIVAKGSTGKSTLSKSLTAYRLDRPAITSITNSAAKKITVKWAKNAKATGYQIQYSTDKNFASSNKAVNITKAGTVSNEISSLTKGKTYYVRIRTYKTVGNTKYWSAWSAKKSVKISK